MFVYYSWLFTAHICLLHMIVYYTCFSATHVCLLHLGDEVLLMKLKTSKFIQSFLVTGTPPLVWGHLSKTHAPEKENQDFKVFFFVCIQMIFYNCFILIIAKLSLNFNFDKVREQTFLYWRWGGGLNWREGDKHFMFVMVQTWKKFKYFRRCLCVMYVCVYLSFCLSISSVAPLPKYVSISAPIPVLVSSSIWVLDRFLSHVMNRYWYHIRSQPLLEYDSLILLTIFLEIVLLSSLWQ